MISMTGHTATLQLPWALKCILKAIMEIAIPSQDPSEAQRFTRSKLDLSHLIPQGLAAQDQCVVRSLELLNPLGVLLFDHLGTIL